MNIKNLFVLLLALLALSSPGQANEQPSAYTAELPPQIFSDPDLCAYAPCKEVVDGADRFSKRMGKPAYVEAFKGDQKIGYVVLSTDVTDLPAYSGKPIITLIGLDTKGVIVGVKVLKHSEPILLVGIPESKLLDYVKQYVGKNAEDKLEIGTSSNKDVVSIDAISGATVTVIVENQVIALSAFEVAHQAGIISLPTKPQAKFAKADERLDWAALMQEGAVQQLTVTQKELGLDGEGAHVDIHFGYLNAPAIGRSILGDEAYEWLMGELKPGEHAMFIVSNGAGSFKGSGFVRGGIYERVQIKQDRGAYSFRDTDFKPLYSIEAAGTPHFRETGIFILRAGEAFSAAYPWTLAFTGNRQDKQTGNREFVSFEREYWLPARYLEGGRPTLETPEPPWLKMWKAKKIEIALFILLLLATALVYAFRDPLVRRCTRRDKRWISVPRYIIWAISIGFVGYYLMAQPSITHVMTWLHSIVSHWKWELFLSDPFIFIFWWFIIITVFIWGRGLFCGWLCPYGSLTEVVHKIVKATPLRRFQFQPSERLHNRLKWLKYIIFFVLVGVSFYSIGVAEQMAEVEPFKTTWLVGVWNRSWPFVTFWVVLLVLSMFTERPFCKYLCPLGAGLAIPTTFRLFGLKRKAECTTCHACAAGCGPQAIDKQGRIDQRECLLCMDCQILYYDDEACPPLAHERKRRTKAGLPLTPIDAKGYFIPLEQVRDAIKAAK